MADSVIILESLNDVIEIKCKNNEKIEIFEESAMVEIAENGSQGKSGKDGDGIADVGDLAAFFLAS